MRESPEQLLEQARGWNGGTFADLTLDEYTTARIIASELSSGSPAELACIGDADLNKAELRGQTVFRHAIGGAAGYGSQGYAGRPVSTARDPEERHVVVSLALHRSSWWTLGAPARGISKGAVRYFDPRDQEALHAEWKDGERELRSCPARVILERWTFDKPFDKSRFSECGLLASEGSSQQEWVGPIAGVDPWRLMLMRPRTTRAVQLRNYELALRVIESRGEFKPELDTDELMLAGLVAGLVIVGGA